MALIRSRMSLCASSPTTSALALIGPPVHGQQVERVVGGQQPGARVPLPGAVGVEVAQRYDVVDLDGGGGARAPLEGDALARVGVVEHPGPHGGVGAAGGALARAVLAPLEARPAGVVRLLQVAPQDLVAGDIC